MNENDLRDALAAIAGVPPAPPLELPDDLTRRARNRRRPVLLAAAAAVVAGILAVVSIVGDESKVRTRPAAGAAPHDFVATTLSGAVVVASSEDGHILRTLAPDTSAVTGVPSRTPDGQWVYYTGPSERSNCVYTLYRVRTSGGAPPERVGPGQVPAVSPDGSRLAYMGEEPDSCPTTLVVRDLATGEEQRWPLPDRPILRRLTPVLTLRWSSDGRHLVFAVDGAIHILDTERPGTLAQARRLEVNPDTSSTPDGENLHAPAWLPDGRVIALRTVREGERFREQVVIVDPETRDLELLTYAAVDATVLDVDPGGRHVLVVNYRGDLFLSVDGGAPRRLDGGFRTAAW